MTNYYIEKDNKIVLFDTDKQKIKNTLLFMPDLQGAEIKETQRPIDFADDGSGFIWADTPEYLAKELLEEKEIKKAQNKAAYEIALKSGVTYKDSLFDCDTLAAVRIMGQLTATQTMAIATEETIDWFDYNYQPVSLTIPEFIELAGVVTMNTRRIETLNCSINTAISNAQTMEELDAVEIDYETSISVDQDTESEDTNE